MKNREIYLGKRQMHSAFILVHPMGACQEICKRLDKALPPALDKEGFGCYDEKQIKMR